MITFNCDWCGNEHTVRLGNYNRYDHHFCGKKCSTSYMWEHDPPRIREFKAKICPICNIVFEQDITETNQKTCCSVKCATLLRQEKGITGGQFQKGCKVWNEGIPCSEEKKKKVSEGVKKAWERGDLKRLKVRMHELIFCVQCSKIFYQDISVLVRQECCSFECAFILRKKRGIIGGQFKKGFVPFNKGKTWVELFGEDKAKEISIRSSATRQGVLVKDWAGYAAVERNKAMKTPEYREWRKAVYEYDEYTCQECGVIKTLDNDVILHAHHIKRWTYYPELRYEISNGITLCVDCHAEEHQEHIKLKKVI